MAGRKWRDGRGVKGWRGWWVGEVGSRRMEGVIGWRVGRMERWKDKKLEGWWDREVVG